MTEQYDTIAIIGAGLGGAALALSLSSAFPKCKITIYESRPSQHLFTVSSGVILTPNSLGVLDKLGVLPLISDKCYLSTFNCFKDRNDVTIRKTLTAPKEQYGYENHRLWRSLLLDTMLDMLKERENVQVLYEHKLIGIDPVVENSAQVTFSVSTSTAQSQNHKASLLIGTDGIYSTVRKILHPTIRPEYTGITGLLTHIPRLSVAWPYANYECNATIQDIPGALFFLAEDAAKETIMVGRQYTDMPADIVNDRKSFDEMQANKDALCDLYCRNYEDYGSTARKILDSIRQHKDKIYMWPFMRMPELPTWHRPEDGRVVILGDAAHALPPSSGQGVNQVLEDVWMLTLLLSSDNQGEGEGLLALKEQDLVERLKFWQSARQTRIDQIFTWATNVQNVSRMGLAEREKLAKERAEKQQPKQDLPFMENMAWLYNPGIEKQVSAWIESRA